MADADTDTVRAHRDLATAVALAFAPLVLGFPAMAFAVFGAGCDRHSVARVFSAMYPMSIYVALSTPFWPLPSLRRWTRAHRLETACLVWLWFTCLTHVTWELAWLLFHNAIARSPNAPWAYAWWAYIDGGDRRYLQAPAALLVMEALSVANGTIGLAGLWLRAHSAGRSRAAVLLFMVTAVVHLYSTTLYYGSEILAGFPSVDTTSPADLWLKFGLANSPWLVMPWAVLVWGWRTISLPTSPCLFPPSSSRRCSASSPSVTPTSSVGPIWSSRSPPARGAAARSRKPATSR